MRYWKLYSSCHFVYIAKINTKAIVVARPRFWGDHYCALPISQDGAYHSHLQHFIYLLIDKGLLWPATSTNIMTDRFYIIIHQLNTKLYIFATTNFISFVNQHVTFDFTQKLKKLDLIIQRDITN